MDTQDRIFQAGGSPFQVEGDSVNLGDRCEHSAVAVCFKCRLQIPAMAIGKAWCPMCKRPICLRRCFPSEV
jgi:hypothetical protein